MSITVTITDEHGAELAREEWEGMLVPETTVRVPDRIPVTLRGETIGWLIRRSEARVKGQTIHVVADFEALPAIPEHLKGSLDLLDVAYQRARTLYADSLGEGYDPEMGIIAPEGSEWSFTKMPRAEL